MNAERAIDILRRSGGRADLVERAVRMHMGCPHCGGAGGESCYYPEVPCAACGFNVFDSSGVESVMDAIDAEDRWSRRNAL
jgi:hypothetical protein